MGAAGPVFQVIGAVAGIAGGGIEGEEEIESAEINAQIARKTGSLDVLRAVLAYAVADHARKGKHRVTIKNSQSSRLAAVIFKQAFGKSMYTKTAMGNLVYTKAFNEAAWALDMAGGNRKAFIQEMGNYKADASKLKQRIRKAGQLVKTGAKNEISSSWVVEAKANVSDAPLASSASDPLRPLSDATSLMMTTDSNAVR